MRRRLLALLLFLFASSSVWADWPPQNVAKELGLADSTTGGREVRIWLGGGMIRPYDLYRIFETGHGILGERIVWMEATNIVANLNSARNENSKSSSLQAKLESQFCKGHAVKTQNYLFCRVPLQTDDSLWPVIFADLLPDQLWTLSPKLDRNCGVIMMDGEAVGIEILAGQRHHSVAYFNPDFCCPHESCAIASHARQIVRHIK